MQPFTSSNTQNQQKDGSLHRETNDLNILSSGDEGPVHHAKTWNVDSVGNSEHQVAEFSGYYRSDQRWRLERTADKGNVDIVTVLQGAFMREGVKRLVTSQERLLLHNVYKDMASFIENKFTKEEKQNVL